MITGGITEGNREFTYEIRFKEGNQNTVTVRNEKGEELTFSYTAIRTGYRDMINENWRVKAG